MKYDKPVAKVISFDFSEFIVTSGPNPDPDPGPTSCNSYTDSVGHKCGTYTSGSSCLSWSTPSFGGGSCGTYDGKKCYGYTDGTHSNCAEYGISCGKF